LFSPQQVSNLTSLAPRNHSDIYFTRREMDVLLHLLHGKTAKQTAGMLGISSRTVENICERIKEKANCKNKYDLIAKYLHLISS
jgi:DNA-binding CsgD family transcriptional regulator